MSEAIEHTVGEFLNTLQIHTESENDRATAYLEELTDRFEAGDTTLEPVIDYLTQQIVKYEETVYPMAKPTAGSMLAYLMEQHGHTQSDLKEVASQSIISELLSGKREMNLNHIRKLADFYHVTPETFI
ncbi:MAG: helix-turn-helix domain-containing protein [Spirochaetales bacterium]|nr:helix-turn-helix domain-containing protein [Spirochaetales bacterium]